MRPQLQAGGHTPSDHSSHRTDNARVTRCASTDEGNPRLDYVGIRVMIPDTRARQPRDGQMKCGNQPADISMIHRRSPMLSRRVSLALLILQVLNIWIAKTREKDARPLDNEQAISVLAIDFHRRPVRRAAPVQRTDLHLTAASEFVLQGHPDFPRIGHDGPAPINRQRAMIGSCVVQEQRQRFGGVADADP